MFGFTTSAKEEEEITKLISDFDNIFTNELISNNNINIQKIDNNQDIVYKSSEITENSEGLYNINAITINKFLFIPKILSVSCLGLLILASMIFLTFLL